MSLESRARALLDRMSEVEKHPAYEAAFCIAHLHGAPYDGPTWEREKAALEVELQKSERAVHRLISRLDALAGDPAYRLFFERAGLSPEIEALRSVAERGEDPLALALEDVAALSTGWRHGEEGSRLLRINDRCRMVQADSAPKEDECCGEISLEGAGHCGRRLGHAGPHGYRRNR